MAKIPTGNFGNVIPQSGGRPRMVPGAFDKGAQALQQFGETGMKVAAGLMAEERQQDEALKRAKAANAVLDREIAVKGIASQIEQEVGEGKLHYTDVPSAYQTRLAELPAYDTKGLDPALAEHVTKGFKRADFTGETSLAGVVTKARAAEFKGAADTLLDKLGKGAGLPGADVAAINAQADAMDEIGRQAYGKDWDKLKQGWRDKNWNDHVGQLVLSNANSMEGLNALEKRLTEGDLADKLDSDKRNVQAARIANMKTTLIAKAEAAANRAERENERRLKKAEAEFTTFQALVDKGTAIDPAYGEMAIKATAGTPYQRGVVALLKQANETGGIASKPLGVQQATLDALDQQIATQGRTPELDKRRDQIDKVLTASKRDLKENGLRAGLERGVITSLAPLDVSTPEAFAASVGKRLEQAETVGLWAGKPVSPLDAREAESLRGMLDALPPKQKSQAVATLSQALGPRASSAVAAQLDDKDKPLALAFAVGSSQTTSGRYTSELIIKGATAIKDGAVMKDDKKVTGWKATIAQQLEGVFPNEQLAQATKDAAYFIAAGIAQEQGGSVSSSDLERSVRLALGGQVIERNGKKLPIPAGLEAADLDKRLRSVTADEIMKQTGPAGGGTAPGMVAPGNIDLGKRPTVKNSDGTISTVRSMSVNIDGAEVLIPTVSDDGKILTEKQAIDSYLKTGKHLGKFKTPEAATAYAEQLHNQQATAYTVRAGGVEIPVADFVKSLPGQELMYAGPGRYAVIVRGRPVVNAAGKPIYIGVQ